MPRGWFQPRARDLETAIDATRVKRESAARAYSFSGIGMLELKSGDFYKISTHRTLYHQNLRKIL